MWKSNPSSDPSTWRRLRLLWISIAIGVLIAAGGSAISIASARESGQVDPPASDQRDPSQSPESRTPNSSTPGPQAPGPAGKNVLFADHFAGGKPELSWAPYPMFNGDNMRGDVDATFPGGPTGVGVLDNRTAGGFAALSYVVSQPLNDFYLETWIRVTVTTADKGPLNGVAFGVDPFGGSFYRLAAQFDANPKLNLAYVGSDTNNFPVMLGEWTADQIPGGVPKESGWHKMAVSVSSGMADLYWDGKRLPGGPIAVDNVDGGMVGVYSTFTGGLGLAETRVTNFTAWSTQSAGRDHTLAIYRDDPLQASEYFRRDYPAALSRPGNRRLS